MKYNYHTHTARCQHAIGTDEEYVLKAIEAGYDEIGFSDHSPWPFENGYVSYMRMSIDEMEGYISSIKNLREKYKDKISIKIGFECEYFRKYLPWLRQTKEKYGLDYLILGHHFPCCEQAGIYNGNLSEKSDVERYKTDVVEAIESGMFLYVAHPDLYMNTYPVFDETCENTAREIIESSLKYNVPLEYNLLGLLRSIEKGAPGYPYPDFWKIAGQMGAKAVIGVDAHDPKAFLNDEIRETAFETLKKLGVKTVELKL